MPNEFGINRDKNRTKNSIIVMVNNTRTIARGESIPVPPLECDIG